MAQPNKSVAQAPLLGVQQDTPPSSRQPLQDQWFGKIHCGDCLEIMGRLPARSMGLVVTSPPYNIKNSTGNGLKCGKGGKWSKAELIKGYESHEDCMGAKEYVQWQRDCLAAMFRLINDAGAIFYNHKWRVQGGLMQDRADIVQGFPVRQIIIWQRSGGINFNRGYFLPTYEVVYLIAKPDFVLAPGANKHGDVWRVGQEMNNQHPAPFPVELAARCISSTPLSLGAVLDPFMGSGTTAIAASRCGRQWLGIEKSESYCEMARKRIKGSLEISPGGQTKE